MYPSTPPYAPFLEAHTSPQPRHVISSAHLPAIPTSDNLPLSQSRIGGWEEAVVGKGGSVIGSGGGGGGGGEDKGGLVWLSYTDGRVDVHRDRSGSYIRTVVQPPAPHTTQLLGIGCEVVCGFLSGLEGGEGEVRVWGRDGNVCSSFSTGKHLGVVTCGIVLGINHLWSADFSGMINHWKYTSPNHPLQWLSQTRTPHHIYSMCSVGFQQQHEHIWVGCQSTLLCFESGRGKEGGDEFSPVILREIPIGTTGKTILSSLIYIPHTNQVWGSVSTEPSIFVWDVNSSKCVKTMKDTDYGVPSQKKKKTKIEHKKGSRKTPLPGIRHAAPTSDFSEIIYGGVDGGCVIFDTFSCSCVQREKVMGPLSCVLSVSGVSKKYGDIFWLIDIEGKINLWGSSNLCLFSSLFFRENDSTWASFSKIKRGELSIVDRIDLALEENKRKQEKRSRPKATSTPAVLPSTSETFSSSFSASSSSPSSSIVASSPSQSSSSSSAACRSTFAEYQSGASLMYQTADGTWKLSTINATYSTASDFLFICRDKQTKIYTGSLPTRGKHRFSVSLVETGPGIGYLEFDFLVVAKDGLVVTQVFRKLWCSREGGGEYEMFFHVEKLEEPVWTLTIKGHGEILSPKFSVSIEPFVEPVRPVLSSLRNITLKPRKKSLRSPPSSPTSSPRAPPSSPRSSPRGGPSSPRPAPASPRPAPASPRTSPRPSGSLCLRETKKRPSLGSLRSPRSQGEGGGWEGATFSGSLRNIESSPRKPSLSPRGSLQMPPPAKAPPSPSSSPPSSPPSSPTPFSQSSPRSTTNPKFPPLPPSPSTSLPPLLNALPRSPRRTIGSSPRPNGTPSSPPRSPRASPRPSHVPPLDLSPDNSASSSSTPPPPPPPPPSPEIETPTPNLPPLSRRRRQVQSVKKEVPVNSVTGWSSLMSEIRNSSSNSNSVPSSPRNSLRSRRSSRQTELPKFIPASASPSASPSNSPSSNSPSNSGQGTLRKSQSKSIGRRERKFRQHIAHHQYFPHQDVPTYRGIMDITSTVVIHPSGSSNFNSDSVEPSSPTLSSSPSPPGIIDTMIFLGDKKELWLADKEKKLQILSPDSNSNYQICFEHVVGQKIKNFLFCPKWKLQTDEGDNFFLAPPSDAIAFVSENGWLFLWSVSQRTRIMTRRILQKGTIIQSLYFEATESFVFLQDDCKISMWSLSLETATFERQLETTIDGTPKCMATVNSQIWIGTQQGKIYRISSETLEILGVFVAHEGKPVQCMVCVPYPRCVWTFCAVDQLVYFWDAETCETLVTPKGTSEEILCVDCSSDGRMVVCGGDGLIWWDVWSFSLIRVEKTPHSGGVGGVVLGKVGHGGGERTYGMQGWSAGKEGGVVLWEMSSNDLKCKKNKKVR